MGRLSEYFNQHRDNLEEAVAQALKKADSTIESLDRKVKELEQKLRDVAGEQPQNENNVQSEEAEQEKQRKEQEANKNSDGVVTSDQASNPVDASVAAQADKSARKRSR